MTMRIDRADMDGRASHNRRVGFPGIPMGSLRSSRNACSRAGVRSPCGKPFACARMIIADAHVAAHGHALLDGGALTMMNPYVRKERWPDGIR